MNNTKIAGAVVAALIGVPTIVGLFGSGEGGDHSGKDVASVSSDVESGEKVAVLDTSAADEAAAKAEEEAVALAEAEAAAKAEEEAALLAEAEAAAKAEEEAALLAEAEAAAKAEEEAALLAEAEAAAKAEEEAAALAEAEAEDAAMAEAEEAEVKAIAAARLEEEAAALADSEAEEAAALAAAEAAKTEAEVVVSEMPLLAAPAVAEEPASDTETASEASDGVSSSGGRAIAGFDGLTTGTGYADARAMLVEAGWSPRELTDETRLDVLDDSEKSLIEEGFAELEGCETFARTVCRFEFVDGEGKIAAVLTAGDGTPSVIDAFVMDVR